MMPKLVNVNRKMSAPAAAMAGASSGAVTVRNTRRGDAPSIDAASPIAGSMFDQNVETSRTTMVYSYTTCAIRMMANVLSNRIGG